MSGSGRKRGSFREEREGVDGVELSEGGGRRKKV